MTAIRIQVTAEDIAAAAATDVDPVETALTRVAGAPTMVDRDSPDGWMATIGSSTPGSTLVVNLPPAASEYIDRWWDRGDQEADPFVFDLELEDWLVAFITQQGGTP